jgi:hypothetical protein
VQEMQEMQEMQRYISIDSEFFLRLFFIGRTGKHLCISCKERV